MSLFCCPGQGWSCHTAFLQRYNHAKAIKYCQRCGNLSDEKHARIQPKTASLRTTKTVVGRRPPPMHSPRTPHVRFMQSQDSFHAWSVRHSIQPHRKLKANREPYRSASPVCSTTIAWAAPQPCARTHLKASASLCFATIEQFRSYAKTTLEASGRWVLQASFTQRFRLPLKPNFKKVQLPCNFLQSLKRQEASSPSTDLRAHYASPFHDIQGLLPACHSSRYHVCRQ